MARVEAASASVNSDSIKGLAQSIAKPAYRRLLIAEPALRRAVPALIIAFLVTICVGAFVQVMEHRRLALVDVGQDMEAIAEILAARLDRSTDDPAIRPDTTARPQQAALERSLPARATNGGRQILLTQADGTVAASVPWQIGLNGRSLIDIVGS